MKKREKEKSKKLKANKSKGALEKSRDSLLSVQMDELNHDHEIASDLNHESARINYCDGEVQSVSHVDNGNFAMEPAPTSHDQEALSQSTWMCPICTYVNDPTVKPSRRISVRFVVPIILASIRIGSRERRGRAPKRPTVYHKCRSGH